MANLTPSWLCSCPTYFGNQLLNGLRQLFACRLNRPWDQQNRLLIQHNHVILILADCFQRENWFALADFGNRHGSGDRVIDKDRRMEGNALAEIDAARVREFGANTAESNPANNMPWTNLRLNCVRRFLAWYLLGCFSHYYRFMMVYL